MKTKAFLILLLMVAYNSASAQTAGKLTVNFSTKTYSGSYTPKHILAVWVVNSSGTFVKTLMSYYSNTKYVSYLTNWKSATSSTYNSTDAITGATLTSHGSLTCYWNGKNSSGISLADGNYTVWIEFTESNTTGKYTSFSITKGASTSTTTATATSYISSISASWSPETTGINEVTNPDISLYPNPAVSTLIVDGDNIQTIELYTLRGQFIQRATNTKALNISFLPPGEYLARIRTYSGMTTKTFIKK